MLSSNAKSLPVRARLKIDMVIAGEKKEAGDIVEIAARELKYLANLERAELAPAPKAK